MKNCRRTALLGPLRVLDLDVVEDDPGQHVVENLVAVRMGGAVHLAEDAALLRGEAPQDGLDLVSRAPVRAAMKAGSCAIFAPEGVTR